MVKKGLIVFVFLIVIVFGLYLIKRGGLGKKTLVKRGVEVGNLAPDFKINTVESGVIESTSLRGKVVVITSAAAWCPTCVMEANQFAPVYQKYKDKPVVFITVDIDPRDSSDFIKQFKRQNNTPWYYATAEGGRDLIKVYGLNRFEITYVLDKNGVIQFKDYLITSSDKLDKVVNQLL